MIYLNLFKHCSKVRSKRDTYSRSFSICIIIIITARIIIIIKGKRTNYRKRVLLLVVALQVQYVINENVLWNNIANYTTDKMYSCERVELII